MSAAPYPKVFVVVGSGDFPLDMLRYDSCWPETSSDAAAIATPTELDAHKARRMITLLSADRNAPTRRRWESFTWRVV